MKNINKVNAQNDIENLLFKELSKAIDDLKNLTGLSREIFENILKLNLDDRNFIELVNKIGWQTQSFPTEIYQKILVGKVIVPAKHPRLKQGVYLSKLEGRQLILESLEGKKAQSITLRHQITGNIYTFISNVLRVDIQPISAVERKKLKEMIHYSDTYTTISTVKDKEKNEDIYIVKSKPKNNDNLRKKSEIDDDPKVEFNSIQKYEHQSNDIDGSKDYYVFKEIDTGRYISHPSFDDMDDESNP